ncbi:hypothetical protein M378DRAFT_19514 [Amanita muscaria Koide BX008]|uniref:Uncharacterized protein n=1 Tax=Amanita muscaria (strain Koide BX008) TaxID=946122 RepID=A0A0C2VY96_AMAMK|nr:hypothetical protein M378DRAFT_19514 [Amanita muscaria Koide BX008]
MQQRSDLKARGLHQGTNFTHSRGIKTSLKGVNPGQKRLRNCQSDDFRPRPMMTKAQTSLTVDEYQRSFKGMNPGQSRARIGPETVRATGLDPGQNIMRGMLIQAIL